MLNSPQPIQYFRNRKIGPETKIEDSVVSRLDSLFPLDEHLSWKACSLPIGAGIPDIVVVEFKPEVYALCHVELPKAQLLAYLRAIPRARVETIANRLGEPCEVLIQYLEDLVKFEIVQELDGVYRLSDCWKDILPDITTIEVKVTNWKRAIAQAARNRIFSHRSYVALPHAVANRVQDEQLFKLLGIGILSVRENGDVAMIRSARRFRPKVWDYYYKIAEITALHVSGGTDAIQRKY